MKRHELINAGINEKAIDEADISVSVIVVNEQFNRRHTNGKSYRSEAVERLIDLSLPFDIESNIVSELTKKLITVTCPYCQKEMVYAGGGGNGEVMGCNFKCPKCQSIVSLRFDCKSGISVCPTIRAENIMKRKREMAGNKKT
ncbi:MAG: hypothetical protein WC375_00270 [Methanomassiliicoccales archaeon]|jgi:hypothetical protein